MTFGDIKDILDSCGGNFGIFLVEYSCALCPLSKMVLNLSVAAPSDELQSLAEHLTNQLTNHCQVKIGLLRLSEMELGLS